MIRPTLRFAAVAAVLAALCAPQVGAQIGGQAKLSTDGDWEWYELNGRRIASTYPESGSELRVSCTADGGPPGQVAVWIYGEPVDGPASLSFDGQAPVTVNFIAEGLVGVDAAKQRDVSRLIARIRSASRLTVTSGAGEDMTFSMKGSANAIGPCR